MKRSYVNYSESAYSSEILQEIIILYLSSLQFNQARITSNIFI